MVIYRPQSLKELVGLEKQIEQVNSFLYDFQNNTVGHKNACLLYGHQGTGKSTIVECVAKDYNFPLIEINGSEIRTKKNLLQVLNKYISCSPRGVKHVIILIDEIDGLVKHKSGEVLGEGRGGIDAIHTLIKNTKHPIFMTANDEYPLRPIQDMCIKVQFFRHTQKSIDTILRRYTDDEQKIYEIIHNCEGDIRSAMNMLDSLSNKVFTKETIFHVVDSILSGKKVDGDIDIDSETLLEWLDENAQYRLLGASHLLAYQNLCYASRMLWKSRYHAHKILVDNVRLVSYFHTNDQIKVLPPSFMSKLKDNKAHASVIKSLSAKLPLHTHRNFESDVLPILMMLSKNTEWLKNIYYQHDLNVDEIALLLGVPKNDITVVSFMEQVKDENKPQKAIDEQRPAANVKLMVSNVVEV